MRVEDLRDIKIPSCVFAFVRTSPSVTDYTKLELVPKGLYNYSL